MISPEEARERAKENFLKGFNCAQSVIGVFCGELGIDTELALKAAQAFGGGTCRLREMCGAVSGMLLAMSIKNGSEDPLNKEAKDSVYKDGQFLCARFKKKNGSFICRELLGLSPRGQSREKIQADSPVSETRTAEYYRKRPCPELCADAAEILAEYLESK